MTRYFFEISYSGTPYFGWQQQVGQVSVQEEIQKNLTKLFQNEKIEIVGCGRTDKGVHAKNYFFHCDFSQEIETENLLYKFCLLYTSPSPRDLSTSRMPSSA